MTMVADPRTLTQTEDQASQWRLIWLAFRDRRPVIV